MCSGRSKEEGDLKLQQSLSVNSMRKHNLEITTAQLNELMMTRGKETVAMIEEKYGNVEQLCAKLGVAPSEGLDSVEANISLRQRVYGDNKITFKSSKSFLALVWEALQDKTLLMLEISAILSLALSFYKPPQEEELDAG